MESRESSRGSWRQPTFGEVLGVPDETPSRPVSRSERRSAFLAEHGLVSNADLMFTIEQALFGMPSLRLMAEGLTEIEKARMVRRYRLHLAESATARAALRATQRAVLESEGPQP